MKTLIHKGDFRRLKADECIALADFWLDEAVRTFTNEATRTICINEAQHWLDLAEDIRLVDANQTRREAAALATIDEHTGIFEGLDPQKTRRVDANRARGAAEEHREDLARVKELAEAEATKQSAALAGALSAELLPQTKTPGDRSNLGKSPASNRSQF